MIEIILSIVVITIAISVMSIGLLFNKPLKGSCGGQDGICTVCGDKTNKCVPKIDPFGWPQS